MADLDSRSDFILDLFHQRIETDTLTESHEFVVSDSGNGVGFVDAFDLDLGLGFGFEENEDEVVAARRDLVAGIETDLAGIDDLDVEMEEIAVTSFYDSFNFEEALDRSFGGDDANEFEWEEIDEGGVDERDVLSLMEEEEEAEGSVSELNLFVVEESERERERLGNLEWEVLLNMGPVDIDAGIESGFDDNGFGDRDDFVYTGEYDMMFGQFGMGESNLVGRPTSRNVIANLNSVVMGEDALLDGNAVCAVCKDEMGIGEVVRELPCCHRYHGECILPWLGIRNTCPVCRFELPTDDVEHEQRMRERVSRAA
ncbi:hypothetical protein Droror1_Dr00026830 [Drosera rotundifolia]